MNLNSNFTYFVIICLLFIFIVSLLNTKKSKNINIELFSEPCGFTLSDREYLEHMIPHHQVAVDISIILERKTKWPVMRNIIRKLIYVQNYEILIMKEFLNKLPNSISSYDKMNRKYISIVSDYISPNKKGLTDTYCDPLFFNPKDHLKHMENMELNDDMYIEHMIPHHQVAVDMSKKLLKNTKNDFMISLAYRIIKSQQEEIIMLNDTLKSKNRYYSSLI